jgi:hypothetical protein
MKTYSTMLDTYITSEHITLREWIHQRIKAYFIPDISDETLNAMEEGDLAELVDALIDF